MKNLKDTLTSIAGTVGFVGGLILSIAAAGVVLPAIVVTSAGVAVTASVAVIGYLTGKNPDGTTKTANQIQNQLNPPKA